MLFKTEVIDQNEYTSVTLSNVNKQQYEVQPAGHRPVWFEYSPVGDLWTVWGIDFLRDYDYDYLGRRTDYWEDNLHEHYMYQDENMIEKTMQWDNPHLGQYTDTLKYKYNHTRLETIIQCKSYIQFCDSIEYFYYKGSRPVQIKDESGIQLFEYGNMGEVTKQTRIFTPPGMDAFAVETQFEYDSWGRTLYMMYPDGEYVDYSYDYGGQLVSVKGDKSGPIYTYLDSVQYNEYGAKTEQTYGNHLRTYWQYNPLNQRLTYQEISKNGQDYLRTQYSYDAIGNIIGMYNDHDQGNVLYTNHVFDYDAANQLISAREIDENMYDLQVDYGDYGRMGHYKLVSYDPILNADKIRDNNYHYQNNSNSFAPDNIDEHYSDPNNGVDFGTSVNYTYGINGSIRSRYAYDDGTGNPHENFYLFDAYGNMNAYSDNEETYAYYSYDDAGQRAYKMTFDNTNIGNNADRFPYLEQDKISFYPNGFVNINQYGEYTKHYYAETQRIASKIGTGSILSNNLCDNLTSRYNINQQTFNELQYQAEDKMQLDLTFVVIADEDKWVDIQYDYTQICDLYGSGSSVENEIYYYHGNHLSSTQMITDYNGTVTQQIHYAPFGEIISEYNSFWYRDIVPNYTFNGKELDEESGMYYYSARYYAPPTFVSRDPMFEDYPTFSPYAYCGNNPVVRIDPTGETWYQVNDDGYISEMKDKDGKVLGANDDFDMLHSNRKGVEPLKIENQDIMKSLSKNDVTKHSGYTSLSIVGNRDEMTGIFNFLADNTSVEWSFFGIHPNGIMDIEKNFIYTSHDKSSETFGASDAERYGSYRHEGKTAGNLLIFFQHSHPEWTDFYKGIPGNPDPSGADDSHYDMCMRGSPNAEFSIRYRGKTRKYYEK